jgi:predicted nuclease of restriction endonuclease-like (RecB) superfamily
VLAFENVTLTILGLTQLSQYASGTLRERWLVRDATSLIATFKYFRSVTHPTEKICQPL